MEDLMKSMDLYSIILDGFIEVLELHGVKVIEIPNTLTTSIAEKCFKQLQKASSNKKYKEKEYG